MVSGGADSACAAAGLARVLGAEAVHASHVNYGLRAGAADGEAAARRSARRCGSTCTSSARSGCRPATCRPPPATSATTPRERLRDRTGAAVIVTGHTRTDVAETALYRLAASPGIARPARPRAAQRPGRPPAARARARADPRAGDRRRAAVRRRRDQRRPALRPQPDPRRGAAGAARASTPAPSRNIAETRAELAEEAALLERVVLEALDGRRRRRRRGRRSRRAALAGWEPGLRRLALRALAERAAGRQVPLGRAARGRDRAARLAPRGRHDRARRRADRRLRVRTWSASRRRPRTPRRRPRPSPWRSPGWPGSATGRFAPSFIPARSSRPGPDARDARRARARRARSRSAPGARATASGRSGCRGTKTLGDLFTDGGVPRSLRHSIPVVTVDGEVAWVAGVAVSEDFRLEPDTERVAVLTARPLTSSGHDPRTPGCEP